MTDLGRENYRPAHVSAFHLGDQTLFSAIWEQERGLPWIARHHLTSAEYHLGVRRESGVSVIQEALLAATSADTVRRRIYTGKPARLLKTRWTDAWDAPDAPEPLPMPLQNILVSEAHQRMNESTDPSAVAMPVGQIVGRMNEIRPVADIIAELVQGFGEATKRLDGIRDN